MAYLYNSEHLEAFQTMAKVGEWKETTPDKWISTVGTIAPLSPAITGRVLTRDFLKSASSDKTISDRDLLWGILAWGRMRYGAARRFAENEVAWLNVMRQLRSGTLSRAESYALCADTAARRQAGGIGPAYFTKLIFFAHPAHDGYIMDQWTSRSVNLLLANGPIIRMRTKDHVDPRNDAKVFDTYCCIVEDLSRHLIDKTPEQTEQCLFSTGWDGKTEPARWRRHVMEFG